MVNEDIDFLWEDSDDSGDKEDLLQQNRDLSQTNQELVTANEALLIEIQELKEKLGPQAELSAEEKKKKIVDALLSNGFGMYIK